MENRHGKSICLFSGKGGVGKTILALNLAGVLEIMEKKVLIMDLDLTSGGVCLALNLPYQKSISEFAFDEFMEKEKKIEDYITKYDDYIDVLACPKDPRTSRNIDPKYLEYAIYQAKINYDIVLIDTSHVLYEPNLAILDCVDEVLFVLNNDPIDIKNLKSILTIFKELNKTNYKILLNESKDPFKKYFTNYDIKTIIKDNIDYSISSELYVKNIDQYILNGKIVLLEPKAASTFSKDFQNLTKIATDLLKKDGGK